VDLRARPIADPGPLAGEKIDQALQDVLHLVIDLAIGVVEHHGNAVVGERLAAGSGEVEPPARRPDRVRPGNDVEGKSEVFCAAGERSDHGDVRRRDSAPQSLTAWRSDPVSRLMAEDSTVMRRVADRSPNIAAELEPGQPGGECSRGTARG